jgi:hypothetical protein
MKFQWIVIAIIVTGGCCKMTEEQISAGVSEQCVKEVLGVPDFIYEQSGDLGRTYKGSASLEYKWPDDAIKIYYYIGTNKEYHFTKKHLLEIRDISEERKARLIDKSKYKWGL